MTKHSPDLDKTSTADAITSAMTPSDQAQRRAYVQKWIARNQRRMAAGLGSIALTLPLLAQAQTAEGMVNALDIGGVRSVAMNADGSAQLTLANGQQIQVGAASVQVAADGSVMLSSAAAQMVAEAIAAGAGTAAAAGGIGGAGAAAAVGGLGLLAAAAGGGSSSEPEPIYLNAAAFSGSIPKTLQEIFGVNPEIDPDAKVFVTFGDGERIEVTIGSNGEINFPSGLDLESLQGEQTFSFVVELTELVEVENEDAEEGDEEAEPVFEEVTNVTASGTATVIVDTIAPELEITTPIAGDDILNAAEQGEDLRIEGTAEGAEDGQVVTLTFNGQDYTAVVTGEAWLVTIPAADLAGLESGAEIEITANVSDRAGNPAVEATATLATDFIATIDLDPVTIETLNTFTGVEITGETVGVEAGRFVTVTFDGVEYTGQVGEDGTWTVSVPASDIKALSDGSDNDAIEVAITASVSDAAGNPASTNATVITDFSAPALTITSPASGEFINADDASEPLEVSGQALPDANVTVTLTGGAERMIQADGDGAWSTSFEASDLPADGPVEINAASEIEGVSIDAPTVTLTKDTVAPEVSITNLGLGDDILNIAEQASGFTISGTVSDAGGNLSGVTVSVSLNGGAPLTAVLNTNNGTWTAQATPEALSGITTGQTIDVVATARDAAGNASAPDTESFTSDFTVPQITIANLGGLGANDEIAASDLVNDEGEDLGSLLISGTSTAPEGSTVTITIGSATLTTQVQSGGTWSAPVPTSTLEEELTGLESIAIGASVTNTVGNSNTATLPLGVDLMSFLNYEGADFLLVGATAITTGAAAGTLEFTFLLDTRTVLPDDLGLAIQETLTFDTGVASWFSALSASPLTLQTADANATSGEVTFGGFGFLSDEDDEGEPIDLYDTPLVRFRLNHEDTSEAITLSVDSTIGGSYEFIYGTDGADTLTADSVDSAIRGRGGNDQIDVSAPGVNTVIFEGGSNANGFDTITGFTLDGVFADRIAIAFDMFDQDELRGDGTDFQLLSGGAVGADVGLLVFTTAIANFENATVADAVSNLTGLTPGDSLYVLIGDGTDAILTSIGVVGEGIDVNTSSGTSYAEFKGIGDLSGFSSANILGFEQHNV